VTLCSPIAWALRCTHLGVVIHLSSFFSAHRPAIQPIDTSPTALFAHSHRINLPRILPLLSAALQYNSCSAAEAFQGSFASVFIRMSAGF
jgi:hypothetical protein